MKAKASLEVNSFGYLTAKKLKYIDLKRSRGLSKKIFSKMYSNNQFGIMKSKNYY